MTDLTDPVQVDVPLATPSVPLSAAETPAPHIVRRPGRRFRVRTSTNAHFYESWERAKDAARSIAVEHGIAATIRDDNSKTRFAPDGCASPSAS